MALVKKHVKQDVEELVTYTNLDDAREAFNSTDDT